MPIFNDDTNIRVVQVGLTGATGGSGVSGYSGYSGFSGDNPGSSGFSGFTGESGFSGESGYSGYSGTGQTGLSGFSGFSGEGFSGFTGISGYSGFSGPSGFSGFTGISGFSGNASGYSGFSGWSGDNPGSSGYSGYSGRSGFSGYSGLGTSGFSGYSGIGTSGFSGFTGASGASGISGWSGRSGWSGWSGFSGRSGYSGNKPGASGYSGFSGVGDTGTSGYSGFSGYSGLDGGTAASGFSGFSGYSGFTGVSGYSGFTGVSGYSGYSGVSGYSGFSSTSGYSGFSGTGGASTNPTTLFVPYNNAGTFADSRLKRENTNITAVNGGLNTAQTFKVYKTDDGAGTSQWLQIADDGSSHFEILSTSATAGAQTLILRVAGGGTGMTLGTGALIPTSNRGLDLGGSGNEWNQCYVFQLIVDASADMGFASSSKIAAPANGQLTLLNQAGSDFTRLNLGGTSSAFPSLKRNSAGIDLRLADDSAYAALTGIVNLTAAHATDDTYTGTSISGLNAGATIAQWEAVYLDSSSTWQLADANGSSTYPARGLAVAAYSNTNPAIILVQGTVRNDAWSWTPGGTIYLSGTAGGLTQTAPSASGDKVQQVGFALDADRAYFDMNTTYLTIT